MAVHTGFAHDIHYHPVTQALTYSGSVVLICKKLVDIIHGGQIVLSQQTFRKIALMLDRFDHPQVLDLGLHRLFKRHDNIDEGCQNETTALDYHGAEEVKTHKNLHRHSHHTWLELYQILPKSLSYDYYNVHDMFHNDIYNEQHHEDVENHSHDSFDACNISKTNYNTTSTLTRSTTASTNNSHDNNSNNSNSYSYGNNNNKKNKCKKKKNSLDEGNTLLSSTILSTSLQIPENTSLISNVKDGHEHHTNVQQRHTTTDNEAVELVMAKRRSNMNNKDVIKVLNKIKNSHNNNTNANNDNNDNINNNSSSSNGGPIHNHRYHNHHHHYHRLHHHIKKHCHTNVNNSTNNDDNKDNDNNEKYDISLTSSSTILSSVPTTSGRIFPPLESLELLRGGFNESPRDPTTHQVTLCFVFLSFGKVLEDLIDDYIGINEEVAKALDIEYVDKDTIMDRFHEYVDISGDTHKGESVSISLVVQHAINKYTAILRETLIEHSGHECQEDCGAFMLAFHNRNDAINFGIKLRESLEQASWHPVFAALPISTAILPERARSSVIRSNFKNVESMKVGNKVTKTHTNINGKTNDVTSTPSSQQSHLFCRGLCCGIGIIDGRYLTHGPHQHSGRADYFGSIVNRTARLAGAAHGGQLLVGLLYENNNSKNKYDSNNRKDDDDPDNINHNRHYHREKLSTVRKSESDDGGEKIEKIETVGDVGEKIAKEAVEEMISESAYQDDGVSSFHYYKKTTDKTNITNNGILPFSSTSCTSNKDSTTELPDLQKEKDILVKHCTKQDLYACDIGKYMLKGINEPLHIFEIQHDHGNRRHDESDFRPIRCIKKFV